ncbi:uncharacterized protein MONOS_7612 [Monocercomonoides exilis]|uniref:uncharacterized protein n=1 Tax=Monocercomonoides exilis TaxID=2049356 RepID=UPI0035596F40|nr:hypothetical protein MONOS_7612 [Monocercomonoides exilis]|eukprot:MONOS_7612.1-p1 / transcript=MONOS_7612.1 / gene=MONOS_7612 / organism=Monocercomonoides_exilis_PA203 / gene_product=unspecified product / transcript_product=unspecified product / location=Mono_scaffold00265:992-1889(+) / protein_length=271 / sequence_SO=supercontig / SO=protein_coding / is_pseudo=false
MANEINAPDMGPSEKVVLFTTLNFYNELCKEFSNRQFHKSDPSNRNQCVSNSSNDKNYIVEDDNSKLREQTDDDIDQLLEDNITKWKPDAFMLEHYFQDQEYEVDGKMISKIAELRKEDMLNEWKNEDYNFASFCGQTHKRERAEYDDERSCILQDADETEIDISNWKRRKEIIQKQIKEAKHYKSLFGKWVRKGWIVDAKEAEMWDEAEKKLKMKEMMEKDGVAEEKTGKKTLEEMKTKLVECEERTDCQEEIEALRPRKSEPNYSKNA